jgi:SAM-dependent methyltransferase
MTSHGPVAYDRIGYSYGTRRVADPRIASAITRALGDARTVINVGAGAGSYEPDDRPVLAIEPSVVMAAQRPEAAPPAVLGYAEDLPIADDSVDAAMAVLTVHHWSDPLRGLREMLRVARRRVVLLTVDVDVQARMWLFSDYMRESLERDRRRFPSISDLRELLGDGTTVRTVPVPRDCSDGFLLSFWGRPEAVLDREARAGSSGFALMDDGAEDTIVDALRRDLADGTWDQRYGALRKLETYDSGLRLVITEHHGVDGTPVLPVRARRCVQAGFWRRSSRPDSPR